MIRIGRLNINLPPSMKGRAENIARHAAGSLAEADGGPDRHIDAITGLRISASAHSDDRVIGRAISRAILDRTGCTGAGDD